MLLLGLSFSWFLLFRVFFAFGVLGIWCSPSFSECFLVFGFLFFGLVGLGFLDILFFCIGCFSVF